MKSKYLPTGNIADMYRSDILPVDVLPISVKHLGRDITFDHCRYIPVKGGFKVYYIVDDSIGGQELTEDVIPSDLVDVWEEFIQSIDGKIPTEQQVDTYLKDVFLRKLQDEK